MSYARSESAWIAARDVPELEQEVRLRQKGGAEGDDRTRETRRPASEADGDDGEDRRQEGGEQDGHERRERERHVVGELNQNSPPITADACANTMPVVR